MVHHRRPPLKFTHTVVMPDPESVAMQGVIDHLADDSSSQGRGSRPTQAGLRRKEPRTCPLDFTSALLKKSVDGSIFPLHAGSVREVKALHTDETVTVYQAYPDKIADPALDAGTFVAPFLPGRMTWIKPSFLWMMYRSSWATKKDQERILAVQIRRDDFLWALSQACLSSFDRRVYKDHQEWRSALASSPVRIQWDPDRDLHLKPTDSRAVQVGLAAEASQLYARNWIREIRDVTPLAREVRSLVREGDLLAARARLPVERLFPLDPRLASRIGSTASGPQAVIQRA